MKPTIISSKASNWVDQGQPPQRVMRRVLSFFLDRHGASDAQWLDEQTNTIVGMVAADASEIEVANYLRSLSRGHDSADAHHTDSRDQSRLTAIALWHIAKAALVRDFAERVLQGEVPVNAPTPDTLSHWVASRLLTSDELADFEDDEGTK